MKNLQVAAKSMVAGVKIGAGACDVVFVCDSGDL